MHAVCNRGGERTHYYYRDNNSSSSKINNNAFRGDFIFAQMTPDKPKFVVALIHEVRARIMIGRIGLNFLQFYTTYYCIYCSINDKKYRHLSIYLMPSVEKKTRDEKQTQAGTHTPW